MTYDPDRGARAPDAIRHHERPHQRRGPSLSVALMLGLMIAFVAAGFWLTSSHNPATTADDRPVIERNTTGSGSTARP